jgi:hypothetical protein
MAALDRLLQLTPNMIVRTALDLRKSIGRPAAVLPNGLTVTKTVQRGDGILRAISPEGQVLAEESIPDSSYFRTSRWQL